MAKTVAADDIIKAIRAVIPHAILKDVQVFDVYAGKEIEPGHVSIALACIFQNFEKTMVEADIIGYQDKILQTLKQKFDIQLRDGR
jgi:phenylalanyl-tRNA synthetase beta chain